MRSNQELPKIPKAALPPGRMAEEFAPMICACGSFEWADVPYSVIHQHKFSKLRVCVAMVRRACAHCSRSLNHEGAEL